MGCECSSVTNTQDVIAKVINIPIDYSYSKYECKEVDNVNILIVIYKALRKSFRES